MHEKEPSREVIQPPEIIFEANLVSHNGDSIPIDNQMVQVYRFDNDQSSNFIDITQKTNRHRIFIEDELVLKALSGIGCWTFNYSTSDSYHYDHPACVTAGGEWNVIDSEGRSLVDDIKNHGRIVSSAKQRKHSVLNMSFEHPEVEYNTGDEVLILTYSNTTIVDIGEFPEMSHVLIEKEVNENSIQPLYFFGDDELRDGLLGLKFNHLSVRYPDARQIQMFIQVQEDSFEDTAADLLRDSDSTE